MREIYPSRFGQNMQILLPLSYKTKFGFIDEPLMIYFLQDNSHSQAATPEEQLIKNDVNFYGYQDIYLHMLDLTVKNEKEYNYYLNIIKSWQYKHELKKAMLQGDKEKMEIFFDKYKATGRMTLNEEIEFCMELNFIKAIILKIYRRLRTVFC